MNDDCSAYESNAHADQNHFLRQWQFSGSGFLFRTPVRTPSSGSNCRFFQAFSGRLGGNADRRSNSLCLRRAKPKKLAKFVDRLRTILGPDAKPLVDRRKEAGTEAGAAAFLQRL